MAERSFFTLRYSTPGYVFLLFLLLICYDEFLTSSLTFQTNLIIALSGPAIGFIIAQIWFTRVYHKNNLNVYRKDGGLRNYTNYLHKIHNIKNKPDILEISCNFIYGHSDNEGLKGYVNRRWDLYRVLGVTKTSIILSIIISMFVKLKKILLIDCISIIWISLFVIIGSIIYYLLEVSMIRVENEHDSMVFAMLEEIIEKDKKIMEKLPQEYFY